MYLPVAMPEATTARTKAADRRRAPVAKGDTIKAVEPAVASPAATNASPPGTERTRPAVAPSNINAAAIAMPIMAASLFPGSAQKHNERRTGSSHQ